MSKTGFKVEGYFLVVVVVFGSEIFFRVFGLEIEVFGLEIEVFGLEIEGGFLDGS